ncbi:MAG: hypothetical protein QW429_01395 [Thermoprotei archaeon]
MSVNADNMVFELLLILLVTFVSNATPFFGVSYTLLSTSFLLFSGVNPFNFTLVVLTTGISAALAKTLMYYGALGFSGSLKKNKNIRLFSGWINTKSFLLALFIAAFIPILPLDDYIYIGAGANRAKLSQMLTITISAKIAKSVFEISLELLGIISITDYLQVLGISAVELSIILSVFFVVLGVVLYKLDWENILGRITKRVVR